MSKSEVQAWLPYLSQILTAIVAIIAILTSRRSSKETLVTQLNQRVWERRTEIYLEIIRQTGILDPNSLKTPEGFRNAVIEAGEEKVSLLPVEADSNEWRSFEAAIEAFASSQVRFLYWLWDSAVAAWTWDMSAAVTHYQSDNKVEYEKSQAKIQRTYDMVHSAREEIVTQIRAELRFESRQIDRVLFEQDKNFSYLTHLDVDRNRHEKRPLRATRMLDIGIDEKGNLHQTLSYGERIVERPGRDSNTGPTA